MQSPEGTPASAALRKSGADVDQRDKEAASPFEEPHYAVADISEMWSISSDVVRELFEHEPGVLVFGGTTRKGRRRYTTLRIPRSVAARVHRRLCNPDLTGGRARA